MRILCAAALLFAAILLHAGVAAAVVPVTVTKSGPGTGSVRSTPAGIDCGATCTASFATGTTVLLTPVPDPGAAFAGWTTGPCLGIGVCAASVSGATNLTAVFVKATYTLDVFSTGNASGIIHVTPPNQDCNGSCVHADGGITDCMCQFTFDSGTTVVLTATPHPNSPEMFGGWVGAGCSGNAPCTIQMLEDVTVHGSWSQPTYTVEVQKAGDGDGQITSFPQGIDCGPTCSSVFEYGAAISLSASAHEGSTFVSWSGGGCSGFNACYVKLGGAVPTPVIATFEARKLGISALKAGTGDGTITSQPAGVSCPVGMKNSCESSWKYGTAVTVTATAAPGSTFVSWDDPACTGATCAVVMTTGRVLTATFDGGSGGGGSGGGCSVVGVGAPGSSPAVHGRALSGSFLVGVGIALTLRRRRGTPKQPKRSRRFPIVRVGALLAFGVIGACGPSGTPNGGGAPVLPTIVGPDQNTPILVHPGDPVTITVSLQNADGTPATSYIWGWSPLQLFDGEGFTSTASHPAPGTESIVVSWQQVGEYRVPGVVIAADHHEISKSYGSPRIIVWGGPPAETIPVTNAMPMVVGEKRTALALQLATVFPFKAGGGLRTTPHGALAYSTQDPGVATVDAHGVVTAVAVGQTLIDMQQGADAAGHIAVPVTVTAGALGPPPLGVALIAGGPQLLQSVRTNVGIEPPADMHLAIDSRGYPNSLITAVPQFFVNEVGGGAIHALLASWSGSGFSMERINDGWFSMTDPRLAIDERDHLYVVGTGHITLDAELVIAERGRDDGPSGWKYHSPDFRLPEHIAAGKHVADIGAVPATRYAIGPRAGGGAWLVNELVFKDTDPSLSPNVNHCLDVVYLTEVSDSGVSTQVVKRTSFDWDALACIAPNSASSAIPFAILPQGPGEDAPEVAVVAQVPANNHDPGPKGPPQLWRRKAGVWSGEDLMGGGESLYLVPGVVPGQAPLVLGHNHAKQQTNFVGHPGVISSVSGNEVAAVEYHYGFQTRDFAYMGATRIGPVSRVRLDRGDVQIDEPAAVWQAPDDRAVSSSIMWSEDDFTNVGGVASTATRLFFATTLFHDTTKGTQLASVLTRALPGPIATTADPESSGTLLAEARITPIPAERPLVLADGTRYILTESIFLTNAAGNCAPTPGVLLRSAGPGAPPVTVLSRGDDSLLNGVTGPLYGVAGHLYGYSHPPSSLTDVKLVRSSDAGATWGAVASVPTTTPPSTQLVTSTGEAWLLITDLVGLELADAHLYHSGSVEGSYAFQQSFGMTASVTPRGWTVSSQANFGVVESPNGIYELAQLADTATRLTPALLVRHIVNGAIADERILNPRVQTDHTLRLDAAVMASDGALVIPTSPVNKTDLVILHLDPTTGVGTETVIRDPVHIEGTRTQGAAPTRLADGRLVVAYSTLVGPHQLGAVYRVSSDNGITWSDRRLLRPNGGWGQMVPGIAAEPSGGFMAMVGDNEALTFGTESLRIIERALCSAPTSSGEGYPPLRFTLVRVAAP